MTTNPRRIASLWLLAPLGDPTSNSEVTFTYLGMRMIMMQEVIIPPDMSRGLSNAPLLILRLVPWVLLKKNKLKRYLEVLQPPGTKCPRDQRAKKHSTLDLERTRLMALLTWESAKITQRYLIHSQVILRDLILLMLNSERWVGLWPRECSIHQKLKDGLPRRLTPS